MKPAILNNLFTCTGCYTCALACKVARNPPEDIWLTKVITNGKTGSPYLDDPAGSWSDPSTLKITWTPVHYPQCDLCASLPPPAPYCVYNCPIRAKTCGDLDDPTSKISLTWKDLEQRGYTIYQLPDAGSATRAAIYYADKK
jgi:Fe-S-cluster-containing dehydrogenase component